MFHWESLLSYTAFYLFASYNKLWGRDFKGASIAAHTAIIWMGFGSLLVGLVYLVYYGYNYSWLGSGAAFLIGLATAVILGQLLEWLLGTFVVCAVSVIAWPICAFLMFYVLP